MTDSEATFWRMEAERQDGGRAVSERIRWEPTKYGGFTGHVGTWTETDWLFQIWSAASVGGDWQLDSTLPGHFGRHSRADDPATLKADAEFLLAEFVSSLGAVFEPEPAKSRAWHADWKPLGRDVDGNAFLEYKPTGGVYRVLPVEES